MRLSKSRGDKISFLMESSHFKSMETWPLIKSGKGDTAYGVPAIQIPLLLFERASWELAGPKSLFAYG